MDLSAVKTKNSRRNTIVTLVAFALAIMLCAVVLFAFFSIYGDTRDNLIANAEERINAISDNTAAFLQRSKNLAASSAASVEFLIRNGADNKEILDYLIYQTDNEIGKIDESFTGLYGYYRGEYLDGNRWDPYADGGEYYPKERPWYIAAIEAGDEVGVASPYLDMDTGNIVLSVTKRLSDGESVLGLDVSLAALADYSHDYVSDDNYHLAYIVDNSGTIVSSKDASELGLNYLGEDADRDELKIADAFKKAMTTDEPFEYEADGHNHLVISRTIENGWQVILFADSDTVYAPLRRMAIICVVLMVLLVAVLGYFAATTVRERKAKNKAEEKERQYIKELRANSEQLSSYKRAMLSDAVISLEANLTKDELFYGAWKDIDGKEASLKDILGIELPCSYDKYIKLWNEKFIVGESSGEFKGKTDREVLINAFESGKGEITFDYEAKTLSGKKAWFRRTITMTRAMSGDIIAYTNVKDVSDMVEAEKRENSYIAALSAEYDSIAVINFEEDKNDDVISLHGSIAKEFAELVSAEAIEEKNFAKRLKLMAESMHPDDKEAFLNTISREKVVETFENGESVTADFRMLNGDDVVYYQMRLIPLRDDGEVTGMISALRSIDREIKTELGIRKELEEAIAKAEEASRAKTTFLFNMSHDIRTPMNAILGFTRIGRKHIDEPKEVDDCLSKIELSGEQLLDLINDVLEMSRIESGKVNLVYEPVCVTEMFHKVNPMLGSLAMTKSIDYDCKFIGIKDNYVYTDDFHVSRIFTNIVSNAVKYTPNGGKVKAVVEQVSLPEGGTAEYKISVTDTGIGMSEEFLNHMFEEFARENTSTVSGQQGTGLGLSIVKRLTDALGGRINVESKQGVGTKFEVTLPLKLQSEEDIAAQVHETVSLDEETLSVLSGKRALLAEDNELNREIACEVLEERGVTVEPASDGDIAFKLYKEKPFGYYDFILMDIQMPVMDGYESTKNIREFENGQYHTPIIAVSANAFAEDIAKSLESGMDAHIPKPINPDELLGVMGKLIKNEK